MAGPAALLLLGGLLGRAPQILGGPGGALGGSETPPELEEEVWAVRRWDPQPPHCFTRTLHELTCFWETPGTPDPRRYRLQYRLEQDPWQECPLGVSALPPPGGGARFWCSFPESATVTFVPLELRVLPGTPPGTPPETPTGTPTGTTGSRPQISETTGSPPEVSDVAEIPAGGTEGIETPPGIIGTPPGRAETTGSPPGTTGSPPGTTGSRPQISETTGSPPEISDVDKIPAGSAGDVETPPGTTGTPPGTTGSPPGTTRSPPGVGGVSGTPPKKEEPPPPALFHRTIYIDQLVFPGPPQNVSVSAGGARGELCVRWAPPPGPYLHSSLVFELALSPPGGPPKTVGVPAGRREQGVGGLRGSTPYSVRARARPDGISYGGFWSPWSATATATTPPELDAVTLGLSCLLVLLLLGLGALGLLGHRRTLQAKLWPPVPGPEREFEGLFSNYGGNFQLWLCQGPGSPWAPPAPPPLESEDTVEEVGGPGGVPGVPPPLEAPPPGGAETPPQPRGPPGGPSPSPSFEYTLFDPGSALLCPPPRDHAPYANLAPPPKPAPPRWGGHAPHYVICS